MRSLTILASDLRFAGFGLRRCLLCSRLRRGRAFIGGAFGGSLLSRHPFRGGLGDLSPGFSGGLLLGVQIDRGQPIDRPVRQRVQIQLAHLGDTIRQGVQGPVIDRNRRKHRDVDRARIDRGGVARGDDLRIADHDRHDRDLRGHGDTEGPLLE